MRTGGALFPAVYSKDTRDFPFDSDFPIWPFLRGRQVSKHDTVPSQRALSRPFLTVLRPWRAFGDTKQVKTAVKDGVADLRLSPHPEVAPVKRTGTVVHRFLRRRLSNSRTNKSQLHLGNPGLKDRPDAIVRSPHGGSKHRGRRKR